MWRGLLVAAGIIVALPLLSRPVCLLVPGPRHDDYLCLTVTLSSQEREVWLRSPQIHSVASFILCMPLRRNSPTARLRSATMECGPFPT